MVLGEKQLTQCGSALVSGAAGHFSTSARNSAPEIREIKREGESPPLSVRCWPSNWVTGLAGGHRLFPHGSDGLDLLHQHVKVLEGEGLGAVAFGDVWVGVYLN